MRKYRILRSLVIIITLFLFIGACLGSYLLFTTTGSSFLAKLILSKYIAAKDVSIEKTEGNLLRGIKLDDIRIKDLAWLPKETELKIQHIIVSFRPFEFDTLNFDIENARLYLPYSDPIVLFANYKKVKLDVNVYSRKVDVEDLLNIFVKNEDADEVSGAITNIDSYIKGSFTRPQLTGVFEIEEVSYKNLTFNNCPGSFAINLKSSVKDSNVEGAIVLQSGSVITGGINIEIEESKIVFSPESEELIFDFRGDTNIADTKINIILKGTLSQPYLMLTSEPAQPQSILMFMLLSGNSLQDREEQLKLAQINPDEAAVKELLDYFLFGADARELKLKLGITDNHSSRKSGDNRGSTSNSRQLILGIKDAVKDGTLDSGRSE